MKKRITIAVAALVLLTTAAFAQRAAGRAFGPAGAGARLEMLAGYLDLTDAQKETAKALAQDAREQSKPIVEQLRAGHEEMRNAVTAGKSDSELSAIGARQGALMGQLAAIHASRMSKFYAQLTPEQKQKAEKLHDTLMSRIQDRWSPHN